MSTISESRTALPTGTWQVDPVHSTVGFSVKHMVVANFRGGCPTDARVTYAVITEKGRETLARAACTHAAVCEEMIGADLSAAELDDLAALLGRLPGVDNIDARACAGGDG